MVQLELERTMDAVRCIQEALAKLAADQLKILVAKSMRHTLEETRAFLDEHSVTRAVSSSTCLHHTPVLPTKQSTHTSAKLVEVEEAAL
jgi:hypothetical protein